MKLFVQIALAAVIAAPVVAIAEGTATAPAAATTTTTTDAAAPAAHDAKMEKTETTKTTHTKKHVMKHKHGADDTSAPAAPAAGDDSKM